MPKMRLNVSASHRGMLFDASGTKAAAQRMITSINDEVAQEGVNRVKALLSQVLQNPTGFYESMIAVERRSVYRGVWDQNVIYGPWLEGTSNRNRTTRFKGYRTFRRVKQELDRDKLALAQPMVTRFITEMNQ